MGIEKNLKVARFMCQEMDRPDLIDELDVIVGNLDIDSVPVQAIRTELNLKFGEIFDIHRDWGRACYEESEAHAEALRERVEDE